jgi:hypothetical protein
VYARYKGIYASRKGKVLSLSPITQVITLFLLLRPLLLLTYLSIHRHTGAHTQAHEVSECTQAQVTLKQRLPGSINDSLTHSFSKTRTFHSRTDLSSFYLPSISAFFFANIVLELSGNRPLLQAPFLSKGLISFWHRF